MLAAAIGLGPSLSTLKVIKEDPRVRVRIDGDWLDPSNISATGVLQKQLAPGWHTVEAFVEDRTFDDEVWNQPLRGYLSGSIDVVLRLPAQRFLVVDYKTNRLGDAAADYGYDRLTAAMLHSDYPLQALLYTAVLHRFLRWRLPGYDPDTHLGGVLYLFVRGMCGARTPIIDGHRAGVFDWRPPTALVVALSDLLHARRAA